MRVVAVFCVGAACGGRTSMLSADVENAAGGPELGGSSNGGAVGGTSARAGTAGASLGGSTATGGFAGASVGGVTAGGTSGRGGTGGGAGTSGSGGTNGGSSGFAGAAGMGGQAEPPEGSVAVAWTRRGFTMAVTLADPPELRLYDFSLGGELRSAPRGVDLSGADAPGRLVDMTSDRATGEVAVLGVQGFVTVADGETGVGAAASVGSNACFVPRVERSGRRFVFTTHDKGRFGPTILSLVGERGAATGFFQYHLPELDPTSCGGIGSAAIRDIDDSARIAFSFLGADELGNRAVRFGFFQEACLDCLDDSSGFEALRTVESPSQPFRPSGNFDLARGGDVFALKFDESSPARHRYALLDADGNVLEEISDDTRLELESPIEGVPGGFFQAVVTHDRQRELELRRYFFVSEDVSYEARRLGSGEVTSAHVAAAPDGTVAVAFRVSPDYIPNGDSDRLEPGFWLLGTKNGAELFRARLPL